MKRFLSWVVVLLASTAVYYITLYYMKLTFWLDGLIGGLNRAAYVILLIVFILPMFAGIFVIQLYSAMIVPTLSQAVYKSRKGARYIAAGILGILFYGFFILGSIIGFVRLYGAGNYLLLASEVLYYGLLILFGCLQAKEGGGPPSKRERLQRKLDKELNRERHENAVRLVREAEEKGVDVRSFIENAETEKK